MVKLTTQNHFANTKSMPISELKSTDTRSLPQIWATLTSDEREDLVLRIYNAKACKTRQTVRNWASGRITPGSPLVREAVANCVSKITGTRVLSSTLFPSA